MRDDLSSRFIGFLRFVCSEGPSAVQYWRSSFRSKRSGRREDVYCNGKVMHVHTELQYYRLEFICFSVSNLTLVRVDPQPGIPRRGWWLNVMEAGSGDGGRGGGVEDGSRMWWMNWTLHNVSMFFMFFKRGFKIFIFHYLGGLSCMRSHASFIELPQWLMF